jgi:hypothetical protein
MVFFCTVDDFDVLALFDAWNVIEVLWSARLGIPIHVVLSPVAHARTYVLDEVEAMFRYVEYCTGLGYNVSFKKD